MDGVSRKQYIEGIKNILMAIFGLRHTAQTRVGNDFVRGVSGGERRRVSIAEMVGLVGTDVIMLTMLTVN
jgi:ATP-binding cassette subfamily G (WHITE) protein 2 (SNQ2)